MAPSPPPPPSGLDPTQPYQVLAPTPPPATAAPAAGRVTSGFDPSQPFLIDTSSLPAAAPDTSLSGAIGYGVDNTAHSLGNTADVIGLPGGTLQGVHLAPQNYQPVSLTDDISGGKWSALPADVIRKGAELLPATAGTLGAIAAAPEALGTAGALGAGALASGAMRYGDNVKAAAVNNGDAHPTTGDYVRGALTTIPQAAIDAIGLRVPGVGSVSSALGRAAIRTGADAVAAGASDQVGQIGDSVGTDRGFQDNPSQTAEAMLGALPARAMTTAPGLAGSAVKGTSDAILSRSGPQPGSPEHAAAIEQAAQVLDIARSALPDSASPAQVANSARVQLTGSLRNAFNSLVTNFPELVGPSDRNAFTAAINQARTSPAGGIHVDALLDQIDALPLPPEASQPIIQGLRTLGVLSDPTFTTGQAAPLATVGRVGGQLAAGIGGVVSDPTHGLMTLNRAGFAGGCFV